MAVVVVVVAVVFRATVERSFVILSFVGAVTTTPTPHHPLPPHTHTHIATDKHTLRHTET